MNRFASPSRVQSCESGSKADYRGSGERHVHKRERTSGEAGLVNAVDGVAELDLILDRTQSYILDRCCCGYDPYDGLKSPLFRLPVLRSSKTLRWGFQQSFRRLPLQIRPVLRIPPAANPVTLALALQGLVFRRATRRNNVPAPTPLLDTISDLVSPGFENPCWGYDFDWQSRYATIPAFHPTVVATGFVVNALYDLVQHERNERAAALILGAAEFVRNDLNRSESQNGICFSYSPTDNQEVLNASMKGARICAQAYAIDGDASLRDLATEAVRFVAATQREDGSWPYSASDRRSWADNFHTCYVLDCLDTYETLTGDVQFASVKARGLRFYLDHFLMPDGAPSYYHDRRYPIDSTAAGQALLTLCRFDEIHRAEIVARWAIDNLALADGAWKYRIHRLWENRLVYMRWSVAWMYVGLARLELAAFNRAI